MPAGTARGWRAHESAARTATGFAMAVLSAVMGTWAFPPVGMWWLIWVAWVPMVVAQYRVLPPRRSWLAPAVGLGGFYAGYLHGLYNSSFAWWFPLIPLAVGAMVGLGTAGWRRADEATGFRLFVIGFPLAWSAVDFLRGMVPAVATDGYPAYALFRQVWFIQPVSIFSIYVLNLLILAVNWSISALVLLALDRRDTRHKMSARTVLAGAAVVGLCLSAWAVASPLMLRDPRPTVTVAAIQTGRIQQDAQELALDVAQTRQAAARGARIIVWREKGLAFNPALHDTAKLTALAHQTGAYLVIGYGYPTRRGDVNDATVISPAGRFLGVYGKQHPAVMFSDDQTSINRGGHPVYDTPYGRLATIICYDLDFTDTARTMAQAGAQIVGVPSWDPPGDATKHYGILVFRAVENRMTMVKADVAYDSAIIDPYGRIRALAVTPEGSARMVLAKVPLGSGRTPLVHLGDWPGWVLVIGFAGLVVGTLCGRPRRFFGPAAE
ncbi:MAG: nitrilase-related carbon-nitrogen hydrolase [Acidimicrobiales bacterium]